MKNLNNKLSEVLDIEPIEVSEFAPVMKPVVVSVENNTIDDDAEYARQNLKTLIQKGNDAADHIVEIAKQSEHPRAFEVAAGLLKNLADMNKDLLEIQKRKQDLQPKQTTQQNINVDKAVFIGSTSELIKQLRNEK